MRVESKTLRRGARVRGGEGEGRGARDRRDGERRRLGLSLGARGRIRGIVGARFASSDPEDGEKRGEPMNRPCATPAGACMQQRDHYQVLGVRRDAAPEEIKSSFKKLVSQCHPDLHPGDATAHERFKEINLAYQVLSDESRRSMYDRFGHRAEEPGSPFASGGPFAGGRVDISEIAIGGILGDLLGVFGVGRGDKGDLKHLLEVSLEEAVFGCQKTVRYARIATCAECDGSGARTGTEPALCSACGGRGRARMQQGILPIAVDRACSRCRGTGRIAHDACLPCRGQGLTSVDETLKIEIPAGVEPGTTQRVSGAGSRMRPDRAAGDLEVTIRVRPHAVFQRDGDDVVCTVAVAFTAAALGGEVDVPTLEGKAKVRVPPGTQPGTMLRVRGKGVPRRKGIGRGDQRVVIAIDVPTNLTDRQRHLLEQFAVEGGGAPPPRRSLLGKLREMLG
jgi:molecular chaperone DnaJ